MQNIYVCPWINKNAIILVPAKRNDGRKNNNKKYNVISPNPPNLVLGEKIPL